MNHFNGLTPAEQERLAILSEEAAEVIQIVGKILRHGYESYNPILNGPTNRRLLEVELGDLDAAVKRCIFNGDIIKGNIQKHSMNKMDNARRYLHHQGTDL